MSIIIFLCLISTSFGSQALLFAFSKCPLAHILKGPSYIRHGKLCYGNLERRMPETHDYKNTISLRGEQKVLEAETEKSTTYFDKLMWPEGDITALPNVTIRNKMGFYSNSKIYLGSPTSSDVNGLENSTQPFLTVVPELMDDLKEKFCLSYPTEEWKSVGFFDDDYIKRINKHWMSFDPPNRSAHYIFAVVYLMLAIVGLTGNATVVFMILRSLRTPSNILVMNLATSDFFMMSKAPIFIFNSFHFGPALGDVGCQIYGFLGGLTGTASIMTLAAIALDRYFVIANPLNPALKTTKTRAVLWILFIWMYSCVFASLPLMDFGLGHYVPEGYLTACSFDYLSEEMINRWFIVLFFFAAWCVPFLIIIVSYIGIYKAVKITGGVSRFGQEKEKRKRDLHLAILVVMVIAIWFVSWTPYAIVALLGVFGQKHLLTPLASMLPAVFCKTAACVNPFVYSLSHPRLHQELFKLFCRKRYRLERAQTQKSTWKSDGSFNLKRSLKSNLYRNDSDLKRNAMPGGETDYVESFNI